MKEFAEARHPYPGPPPSISMVEPGPVITDFEGKLLAQISTTEFPDTDPDTLGYFRDLYLPASRELFRSVGQNPRDVAKVSGQTLWLRMSDGV